jgi:glycosyltransferase involved in cell wall biosynthesis|tara:strand:+ start:938 stop:2065 length:1128 start_codon:yes stop_codon:yes gene_type:complete
VKVALFFTYGISVDDWNNTGLISREIAIYERMHLKNGHEFNFITYGDENDLNKINAKGIKVYPIYTRMKYSKNRYVRVVKSLAIPFIFRDVLRESSILKTNQLKGSWVAILSKIIFKKSLIIRTGYDALKWSKFENRGMVHTFFITLLTKASLSLSDQYNVTTLSDKEFLSKKFNVQDKIKVRPNYINQKIFNDFNKERIDELLFVGRLEEQKNIRFLIDEYKYHQLPKLHIIGEGFYKDELQYEITQNNLNINLIGKVPNQDLPNFYNKYKFFILSSKYEGNPKTLLEAMSSGSVVIGSSVEGIDTIIENNHNGFLINSQKGDLESIFKLIDNGQVDLTAMKQNAINYINQNHSLENLTKMELMDYDRLLSIKG